MQQQATIMMQPTTISMQEPPAYTSMNTGGHRVIPPAPLFGEIPMTVVCGNCGHKGRTTTVAENGACACFCTFAMVFIFCPCVWIPLNSNNCKDYSHYCSNCNAKLGTYRRI